VTKLIECRLCGETKPHRALGLCNACYIREYRRRNPRTTVRELRERLDRAYEDVTDAVGRVFSQFSPGRYEDWQCRYEDGKVVVRLGGQEYKETI